MSERLGAERLLEMVLAGTPDRVVETLAGADPEDVADLARIRATLADLAYAAEPARPSPALRERLLSRKRRPTGPRRPVLLVLDMIRDYLEPGGPLEIPRGRAIVPAIAARLERARAEGMPVVYVCDEHEPGDPDLAIWPVHALAGSPGAEVWPDLAPKAGEPVVKKRTYSAFTGSSLQAVLDDVGADAIVLTGCGTEAGLAATTMDALQRGYVVTIPPDCQAGTSAVTEQVTLATLAVLPPFEPRYAR
jgi:nicotinamidase-related amidase